MRDLTELAQIITEKFDKYSILLVQTPFELTLEIPAQHLLTIAKQLRDDSALQFTALMDICGVDYQDYGISEWATNKATSTGFDRAVDRSKQMHAVEFNNPRFAVVYHLLSYHYNQRLRLKVFLENDPPLIDSVIDIWPAANWYEREAFDLFGILFNGHPDLRRILTDYGFIGFPFRKDFPVHGNVEVRYDAAQKRVIYEPVDIQARTLVPKVIRHDNRYLTTEDKPHG